MVIWRALVLVVSILAFLTLGARNCATAGVHVDVNVGIPAPFVFPAPPPVVVIPGTYVYMVPDIDVDVLFYHGYWYRPHGKHWFRAHRHDGPWVHVVPGHVPRALVRLPPHYRSLPPGHRIIPHGHLKANWGKWERDKHWHKDKEWKAAWKEHRGNGGAKYKHASERHVRPAEHKHSDKHGHKEKRGGEGRDKHGKHGGPRD